MLAEEALRQAEEKYRKIFENALEGIFQTTPEGRYTVANPALARTYGFDSAEELVATVHDIGSQIYVNPEDRARFKRILEEHGSIEGYEAKQYRKDGTEIWTSSNARVVRDENGKALYYEGTIEDITGRKAAEEALLQREAFLQSIMNNVPYLLWLKDTGGRFLAVNNLFARSCGRNKAEDVIGKTDLDIWPADLANRYRSDDIEVMATLKHKMIEEPIFDQNVMTWFETFKAPILDHAGQLIGTTGISRDITERKRAEEALRKSEEKYRSIFENSIEGIFQTTPDGMFLSVNPALAKMCGYESREDLMTSITNIGDQLYVNPEERSVLQKLYDERGLVEGFEAQLYKKDKSTIWISLNARVVRDPKGAILYYEGTAEDITKRKVTERALRKSEERFRRIIETSAEGICAVDSDFNITFVNRRYTELLGYTTEELMGAKLFSFMFEEDVADVVERRERRGSGTSEHFERRFRRKDGNVLWVHASVTPMTDEKGRFLGSFAMYTDITERKQSEQEKLRLESQLFQSQKMEAIGTLAGGIAHDFNNILTALMGYGTLLQMGLDNDSPLRTYVDQMLSSAVKAAQLTQSLLAFSRQQPITLKPVKLNNIIKTTEKLLKRLLTEDITLETNLTTDDSTIMGDATQIDQILFNLATNARDAMPRGGTLVIETKRVRVDREFKDLHGYGEPGMYTVISISDTGIGMDEATKEHIFDPFFTTKGIGKGTGLGLSTVYGIVKQHNGYIIVDSRPNAGTTFHVYLPAVTGATEEEKPVASELKGGEEIILVAEDSEAVRVLMRTILTRYGYTVIEAIDGEDAIDKFDKHRNVDLLIIDSVMPKKNGREVYDEVTKTHPHVKILFTSGYTRDVVLDKGIEEKEFNFISKPVSPDNLLRKVRAVLDN